MYLILNKAWGIKIMVGRLSFMHKVNKYRAKGQRFPLNARVWTSQTYADKGIILVSVDSFDEVPWTICMKIHDVIYLTNAGVLNVFNARLNNGLLTIQCMITKDIILNEYVSRIRNPIIKSIPKDVIESIYEYSDYVN